MGVSVRDRPCPGLHRVPASDRDVRPETKSDELHRRERHCAVEEQGMEEQGTEHGPCRGSRHRGTIPAMTRTVVVDGNNVMGSRPDGWWRNRAEAAGRLVAELAPVAQSLGGAWTVVFDGPEPPGFASPHECLTVVHAGHGRRDGADDLIVELVAALPDPSTALVHTSDTGLRARVHALGAQVAGARALLDEIAAARDTMEPGAGDDGVAPSEPSRE